MAIGTTTEASFVKAFEAEIETLAHKADEVLTSIREGERRNTTKEKFVRQLTFSKRSISIVSDIEEDDDDDDDDVMEDIYDDEQDIVSTSIAHYDDNNEEDLERRKQWPEEDDYSTSSPSMGKLLSSIHITTTNNTTIEIEEDISIKDEIERLEILAEDLFRNLQHASLASIRIDVGGDQESILSEYDDTFIHADDLEETNFGGYDVGYHRGYDGRYDDRYDAGYDNAYLSYKKQSPISYQDTASVYSLASTSYTASTVSSLSTSSSSSSSSGDGNNGTGPGNVLWRQTYMAGSLVVAVVATTICIATTQRR